MLGSVSGVFLPTLNRRLVDHHEPTLFDFLVLDLLAEVHRLGSYGRSGAGFRAQAQWNDPAGEGHRFRAIVRSRLQNKGRASATASIMPERIVRDRGRHPDLCRLIHEVNLDQMAWTKNDCDGDSHRRISYSRRNFSRTSQGVSAHTSSKPSYAAKRLEIFEP